jgi:hypothetical protein
LSISRPRVATDWDAVRFTAMSHLAFHLDSAAAAAAAAAGLCGCLALSALDALDLHDYCAGTGTG